MCVKLDKWDALFGVLIAFVESGAKVLTGFALSIGFREANPFMKSPTNVLSGLALITLVIFALFLLLDPYRKLGLSTLLGVVDADFVHDLLLLLHFSEYTTFAFSVVSAILPLFLTAFVLLYEKDPRKEELKKKRNWKMFNV
jgi:di/tricarboxylate transporter